jgi:hypothetical protein
MWGWAYWVYGCDGSWTLAHVVDPTAVGSFDLFFRQALHMDALGDARAVLRGRWHYPTGRYDAGPLAVAQRMCPGDLVALGQAYPPPPELDEDEPPSCTGWKIAAAVMAGVAILGAVQSGWLKPFKPR